MTALPHSRSQQTLVLPVYRSVPSPPIRLVGSSCSMLKSAQRQLIRALVICRFTSTFHYLEPEPVCCNAPMATVSRSASASTLPSSYEPRPQRLPRRDTFFTPFLNDSYWLVACTDVHPMLCIPRRFCRANPIRRRRGFLRFLLILFLSPLGTQPGCLMATWLMRASLSGGSPCCSLSASPHSPACGSNGFCPPWSGTPILTHHCSSLLSHVPWP